MGKRLRSLWVAAALARAAPLHYVLVSFSFRLGQRHGSPFGSLQTPAGAGALRVTGGRPGAREAVRRRSISPARRTSRSRSTPPAGAAAAPSRTPPAATSRWRGSRSTTAGRISRTCRRSRPRCTVDATRKIITRNDSPDISFDRSINPYRGCEHGCIYCFARPTHAYLGLSPGLDFESKLFVKPEAAKLLERELSAPGYVPRTIAIGTNTDPYQPIEREYQHHAADPRSAGALRPPGRHRHQVGAGDARHRHPVARWRQRGSPRSRCR